MITLKVDEAYAFDYLSILHVKKELNSQLTPTWQDCLTHIEQQVSSDLMNQILASDEYKNMIEANQITFNAVEKARYGSITAKEVDEANMLRYKRKLELQAKFFNNKLTEIKT
jgi:hypothetical protein